MANAVQRVLDVGRRERLSIMEFDPLAYLEGVLDRSSVDDQDSIAHGVTSPSNQYMVMLSWVNSPNGASACARPASIGSSELNAIIPNLMVPPLTGSVLTIIGAGVATTTFSTSLITSFSTLHLPDHFHFLLYLYLHLLDHFHLFDYLRRSPDHSRTPARRSAQ